MTNEEAINRFIESDSILDCFESEAVNLAIKALKQPKIVRCKDCIYANGDCKQTVSFAPYGEEQNTIEFCSYGKEK